MNGLELSLIAILLVGLALLIWRLRVTESQYRASEGRRTAIEGEEHRMFDFLHLLGVSIEEERSLSHLYRTIVEGVEEVLTADGAALYLIKQNDLVPGHLSDRGPAFIRVSGEVRQREGDSLIGWLRLHRAKLEGEPLAASLEKETGRWWTPIDPVELDDIDSLMAVPLWRGDQPFAILAAARTKGTFEDYDWDTFRSMAEQSSFALGNALLHKEVHEKRRLDDELRTAQAVQRVLLPDGNPDWAGYRVRGMNVAARLISGDYFDYLDLPDGKHGVVVADVSGKGVGAGLVMASCRSALRALVQDKGTPLQAMAGLNRLIFHDIRQDMFVSAAYAVLENETGKLTLVRAGHDAPLLFRKNTNEVEVVKPGGLALGIDKGPVFERVTKELEIEMQPGDVLLFYTDGITEAEDLGGEEYGRKRLREVFASHGAYGAEDVLERITADVSQFSPKTTRMDDMTLVAIERV